MITQNNVFIIIIHREDLFITSKLWNTFHRSDLVRKGLDETLKNLNTPYVDLFLIHWPHAFQEDGAMFPKDKNDQMIYSFVDYVDTWREMEKAVDAGLVKGIGVSNFNRNQVERILSIARIKPVMNQVECHPYLTQQKLSGFLKEKQIAVTGYSPLGSPNRPWVTANDPVLLEDAKVFILKPYKTLLMY